MLCQCIAFLATSECFLLLKAVLAVGGFSKVLEICASEGRTQLAKYVSGSFKLTLQ